MWGRGCRFLVALVMLAACGTLNAHTREPWTAEHYQPGGQSWNLHLDDSPNGRVLHMPADRARIPGLLPAERRMALQRLREHERNEAEAMRVAQRFAARIAIAHPHMQPEYERSLAEVFIAASRATSTAKVSLDDHLPILKALPPYTRLTVVAPRADFARIRSQLARLGFDRRARLVAGGEAAAESSGPWARDMLLVVDASGQQILATPMRFHPRGEIAVGDLSHLEALKNNRREVLRTPLYFRAGNLLLLRRQHSSLLFVGEAELFLNAVGFVNARLPRPGSNETVAAFRELTGADRVIVLPNTDRLFHIDQYMAPLADNLVAFLDPLDFDLLPADEQRVLRTARARLEAEGIRLALIPTIAPRIAATQSPVNILPYRDLRDGRASALVPSFPDRLITDGKHSYSLNDAIADAYRRTGIRMIPVEDRFWPLMGNTHCVTVALR